MHDQLAEYFETVFNPFHAAFRKGFGCQTTLLRLLEDWKRVNRQQRVKLGAETSKWETLFKGVPQGSILGPLIFNIFINHIFHVIKQGTLYNYADDNTLSIIHKSLNIYQTSAGKLPNSWLCLNA